MRYTICDVDWDAVEEGKNNLLQYLYDQLEDKVDILRNSSIAAGFGLFLAMAGYCPAWCKEQASCVSALFGFLGLNAAALGFIGAFIKYHDLIENLGDETHHDVDV